MTNHRSIGQEEEFEEAADDAVAGADPVNPQPTRLQRLRAFLGASAQTAAQPHVAAAFDAYVADHQTALVRYATLLSGSQAEGEDPEHPADAEVLPEVSEHPSQAEGEDPEQTGDDVAEPGTPAA